MTCRWLRDARGFAMALTLLLCFGTPGRAHAQTVTPSGPAASATPADYIIGIEDVLEISVWSHPELERTVTVNAQGNVTVPPIGDLHAAGLTPAKLADRISDRLATYVRLGATTVTVVVHDYVSQSVYVTGSVVRPGRYGAVTPPPLFDAINMAGGALPNGDLSRVTIIRRSGTGPHQLTVDVAGAMRDGTESQLPVLRAGDMVVVPTAVSLVGGIGNDQGVGVLGAVNRPGLYPVGPNEDLWMALALAGGPSSQANLSTIRVLTKDQSAQTAVTVDLKGTLSHGNKQPFVIQPGDIVFVDSKGPSLWGAFVQLLTVTRDVANLVAVVRVLDRNP